MFMQTDEQTTADLGIFSRRGSDGLFDLYNQVQTRGGEAILKDMFLNPLSDGGAIGRRAGIIRGFAGLQMDFPFLPATIGMAEKYLREPQERAGQGRRQDSLSEEERRQGVSSMLEIVHQARSFLDAKGLKDIEDYAPQWEAIAQLMGDPAFEPALRERAGARLPYTAIAAYDALFRVKEHRKTVQLLEHIYHLDVYLSVARLASARKFSYPRALEKGSGLLHLEGVYHPSLTTPVGNDFAMSDGRHVVFLTGANMAGKSTFLRAVGTAVYLAHMGFPVPARSMAFSVMDGIYTTINLPDNLGIGASHFYAEVLRVKKIAVELGRGKSIFVIFDELFRGTNVKDAQEATEAIIRAFSRKKSSLFIISSHIVEAGEALRQQADTGFFYLPTRMNGNQPEYTYTLQEGITDDRHGMIIIRNEGILDILRKGIHGC